MDHLQRLRTFVAVAESGSFAQGARLREVSAPAATRAVASLEQHLGALLLQRTTRSLRLTEAGEAFLADCRRILGELDMAEAAVTGARGEPRGTLSVTAPALFGSRHIAPLLFEFLDRHPALQARALFTNRLVHLIDEGLDVALRIAVLPDSGLTAVPVGHMRMVVVGSPAYLQAHGEPSTPAELKQHRAIGLAIEGQERSSWSFGQGRHSPAPHERLVVNANDVKVAAAVAGQGLARALAYQVTDEVRDGRLCVVLAAHEPAPVPVHLVYPAGRGAAAKVREFVHFAAERLRALPVLQGQGLDAPGGRAQQHRTDPTSPATW
ncbi:LysR family transcriptional regulator [Aquabacterium commune]|uniref:LysR family transcriptional regulator n=1 Tax=Aquabacterium commune TaxID=70586 RepID=A0A4R6RI21_9BURK|nr:LysR family transcriptional regulator [Aquabacterium commune]TDP86129.1 LysR family transcriptional regulator [Aquabacterium commune]